MLILTALFFFLIFPAIRRHPDRALLKGARIAHRGLHSLTPETPENSLRAFELAAQKGYWIENDIHITKDGHVVVFHDDTLSRMCGVDGRIEDKTLAELKTYRLAGTDQTIPTLAECLALVDGRVPLLIEFKCGKGNTVALCEAANHVLAPYPGKYCIQSFYPPALGWYRRHRKDICRGQLASGYMGKGFLRRMGSCLLLNCFSRPDFVSYDQAFYRNPFRRFVSKLGAVSLGWTFRNEKDLEARQADFQGYIFEQFEAR